MSFSCNRVLALLLGCLAISHAGAFPIAVRAQATIEPTQAEREGQGAIESAVTEILEREAAEAAAIDAEGQEPPPTAAESDETAAISIKEGLLRVGNRTPFPLRVVVLARNVPENPSNIPAHWDFAPGEGGSEGLTLSLKEKEPLVVGPGDIIVAFTIDGSRRYWGPNVVDETIAPFWNSSDRSWTMILQP
ncbi:hypothetical protein [Synechococcus sp. PCC 7336]|uniref:hypothetical protein n=1 Tax=Synechococcus sp. PCC 7336 TaxID=195250 RepID=UPI00038166C9|nr:hypothetical protein [Synechococcus sp. PCC 7336]